MVCTKRIGFALSLSLSLWRGSALLNMARISLDQNSFCSCCMHERRWGRDKQSMAVDRSAPVRCGPLTFWGSSVAGYGTSIVNPEFGVVFDIGILPEGAENMPMVLISHGHG